MQLTKAVCLNCHRPFERYISRKHLSEGRGKFCSRICFNEYQNKKITITCEICGKKFKRPMSQSSKAKYCSLLCKRRGMLKNDVRYKGHIRSKVLAYNPKACQICGYDKVVEVVHIKARHRGGKDTLDNVVVLCPNHHKEYDRGKITKKELLRKVKRYIDGIQIKRPDIHIDERGRLIEILRKDDRLFKKFGQVYISTVVHNCIKAWHCHKHQTDTIFCIKGDIKLVLYDDRKNSITKGMINEFFIGENNYLIIQIPPNVWHGWKGISTKGEESIVLNVPDKLYNYSQPDELRKDPFDSGISYEWERKEG